MSEENKVQETTPIQEKNVLSEESAKAILDKFLNRLRINIDELPDGEQKKLIQASMPNMIRDIRKRRIEINEKEGFKITIKTYNGGEIHFSLPAAKAKRAMGDKAMTDLYGRIYSMMGACCFEGESIIDKLDITDLSAVETLGAIFLSV